jgi:hypothetical protein
MASNRSHYCLPYLINLLLHGLLPMVSYRPRPCRNRSEGIVAALVEFWLRTELVFWGGRSGLWKRFLYQGSHEYQNDKGGGWQASHHGNHDLRKTRRHRKICEPERAGNGHTQNTLTGHI